MSYLYIYTDTNDMHCIKYKNGTDSMKMSFEEFNDLFVGISVLEIPNKIIFAPPPKTRGTTISSIDRLKALQSFK